MTIPDVKKLSKRAIREAMIEPTLAISNWYASERAKLEAAGLSSSELAREKFKLMAELARRHKRAEDRARRENSPTKMLERREVQAESRNSHRAHRSPHSTPYNPDWDDDDN